MIWTRNTGIEPCRLYWLIFITHFKIIKARSDARVLPTGIELISQERKEQISKHGRTIRDDISLNDKNQLSYAALMLLSVDYEEGIDPEEFPEDWDKEICERMVGKPYKERLIIAGALLAAELDRIILADHEGGY